MHDHIIPTLSKKRMYQTTPMIRSVVFWILMGFILETICQQFAMKFKVVHEAIVECPNKGTDEIQLRLKLLKLNRTLQVMYGVVTFHRDFDDKTSIRVKLWTWQNGGWKAGTGLDFKKDKGCSSLITVLGPVWKEIAAHTENMPTKCPFKKGQIRISSNFSDVEELTPKDLLLMDNATFLPPNMTSQRGTSYTLNNMDARAWDKLPLPGAPVNKYKLEIGFEAPDGTLAGCYSSIFRVSKK